MSTSSTTSFISIASTASTSTPAPTASSISIGFGATSSLPYMSSAASNSPPFAACGKGSAYISDEDLFALDDAALDGSLPFLSEAPPPPRDAADHAAFLEAPREQSFVPLPALGRPKCMPPRKGGRKSSGLKRTKGLSCVREAASE